MNLIKSYNTIKQDDSYVNPKELIQLEEELERVKKEYGIVQKPKYWVRVGDFIAQRTGEKKVLLERKKYIKLAIGLGWFCGAHRFYAKQYILGVLYLLFCWTGIPFAMTLIDLMIILPIQPDENGMVAL